MKNVKLKELNQQMVCKNEIIIRKLQSKRLTYHLLSGYFYRVKLEPSFHSSEILGKNVKISALEVLSDNKMGFASLTIVSPNSDSKNQRVHAYCFSQNRYFIHLPSGVHYEKRVFT